MKKILLMAITTFTALCGCTGKQASSQSSRTGNDSTLIVYYSQTGATKAVAEELQKNTGYDIAAIEAVNPYDGDYDATIIRWRSELDSNVKVEIKPLAVNLDDYKTIFLGFPIWGGTCALPVMTFLSDNSLTGKNIVTFATFGSGGIVSATSDIARMQPEAQVIKGYGVRNTRMDKMPAELLRFLIENGYVKGNIKPLSEYSEPVAVADKDIAIFNQACGDYKFPLGTPVSVAKRNISNGTDYKFDVKTQTPDGKNATSTIYVTVINGEKPEFTEVIRHN